MPSYLKETFTFVPTAGLIADERGVVYGATLNGGSSGPYGYGNNGYGYGTVFKLTSGNQ